MEISFINLIEYFKFKSDLVSVILIIKKGVLDKKNVRKEIGEILPPFQNDCLIVNAWLKLSLRLQWEPRPSCKGLRSRNEAIILERRKYKIKSRSR